MSRARFCRATIGTAVGGLRAVFVAAQNGPRNDASFSRSLLPRNDRHSARMSRLIQKLGGLILSGLAMIDRALQRFFRPSIRIWRGPIPTGQLYRRGDHLVVHALRQTADGFSYAASPLMVLSSSAAPEEIGRAIRSVLESEPHRSMEEPDWKAAERMLPNALGLSSWKDAVRDCVLVEFHRLKSELHFIPTMNVGGEENDRGFENLPERAIKASVKDADATLGTTALWTFERCI
jgi:hypothetical protein